MEAWLLSVNLKELFTLKGNLLIRGLPTLYTLIIHFNKHVTKQVDDALTFRDFTDKLLDSLLMLQ